MSVAQGAQHVVPLRMVFAHIPPLAVKHHGAFGIGDGDAVVDVRFAKAPQVGTGVHLGQGLSARGKEMGFGPRPRRSNYNVASD